MVGRASVYEFAAPTFRCFLLLCLCASQTVEMVCQSSPVSANNTSFFLIYPKFWKQHQTYERLMYVCLKRSRRLCLFHEYVCYILSTWRYILNIKDRIRTKRLAVFLCAKLLLYCFTYQKLAIWLKNGKNQHEVFVSVSCFEGKCSRIHRNPRIGSELIACNYFHERFHSVSLFKLRSDEGFSI